MKPLGSKMMLLLHCCVKLKEEPENASGYRFRGREGSDSYYEKGMREIKRDEEVKRNTKRKSKSEATERW